MRNGNKFFRMISLVMLICFTSSTALAGYTPGELNPILGTPVLMDITTCIQRYGENFCTCVELEQGGTGCYYKRPAAGFYTLKKCEEIWGQGYCECPQENMCQLKSETSTGNPVGCSGQIYVFPGKTDDCNKAGIRTNFRNCCEKPDEESQACSFSNLAKELGWDDAAIALAEAAAMHYAKNELASIAGEIAVQQAIQSGAFDFASTAVAGIFSNGAPTIINNGGAFVIESAGQTIVTNSATVAAEYMAGAFLAAFNFVMWAYAVYQLYSMYDEMTKCTANEKILGCKRAKGVCVETDEKCTIKVFGACLQKKSVFCCFDSVLARIIHEQGRPQIGLGWRSCRGFYLDEFMQIDFTRIDFSEYVDDLTRQMLNPAQVESKVRNLVEKYTSEIGGDDR